MLPGYDSALLRLTAGPPPLALLWVGGVDMSGPRKPLLSLAQARRRADDVDEDDVVDAGRAVAVLP